MVYKWRAGFHVKADAGLVKREIDELGSFFKPADVVKLAKNKNKELHKCFEWDDKKAGNLYREHQARNIIASIVFEEKDENEEKIYQIRSFENMVGDNDERIYTPIRMALGSESNRAKVIAQILKAIDILRYKLKGYEYLIGNVDKIDMRLQETADEVEHLNVLEM